jgi:rhodanese-related sulfurtransferase
MMTIKHLTVEQARQQQAAGAKYLDVRSIPEFQLGHPDGAFNIPLMHADPETRQMRPNPDFVEVVRATFPPETPLVIGCQMGGRSAKACEILANAGYLDVANVLGGYGGAPQFGHSGWVQAGLPVEQKAAPDREYDALQKKSSRSR